MKIVINAVSAKLGGAVTYLTNILRHLPAPESGYEFDVFLPPETAERQEGLGRNVRLVPTSVGHAAWWKRLWWEQVTLRRWLERRKADVLFSSANFGMFGCPVRQLLLVRNPLYFSKIYQDEFLGRHSLRFRVSFRLRRWLICRSVRQAGVVMTPTQAMLDDVRRFVEVDAQKALVNPYGTTPLDSPSSEPTGVKPEPLARDDSAVRLIYVSLYSEHKNLTTLLKAMPLLNRDGGRKFVLKTTVHPGEEDVRWMVTCKGDLAFAQDPEVSPWIEIVGRVGRREALEFYRQGDIFVFPSLCESFGHPMVEAMAHGLPVVASDTKVNREVCGDAAVYFSPLRAEDLAQQVRALAQAPALMAKLGAVGRERAPTLFRWDRHVQRILECAGGQREEVVRTCL